jgi:hypothetical protein
VEGSSSSQMGFLLSRVSTQIASLCQTGLHRRLERVLPTKAPVSAILAPHWLAAVELVRWKGHLTL